ncbi:hypothetical protein RCG17_14065 [Neobacillus sp. PS3-12]|uniref:hypothetical protein n=1 Tax=Neobacillus sp. PS3-12 TaxID=3070677 RepID=UPI0027DFE344|nr:hypothetical protein [Neobacillus sp. PS3-12]WML55580.1 hypothetical protein RCG17_14065 [Neobacillus sp. PS3-12]
MEGVVVPPAAGVTDAVVAAAGADTVVSSEFVFEVSVAGVVVSLVTEPVDVVSVAVAFVSVDVVSDADWSVFVTDCVD